MTLGNILKKAQAMGAGASFGQVATNVHDEALYLILWTLDLPLDSSGEVLERVLTAAQQRRVEAVLKRRFRDHEPAAYITGEAWLGGLRFKVDPRVLIPRSYFVELLGEQVDAWVGDPRRVTRAVDVCTGSGCLAILMARYFSKAAVDAVDLMPGALEVARENVSLHRLSRRVSLHQGDLLEPLGGRTYDVILSNPPYEPTGHVDRLPEEFKREPRVALDGGRDGLDLVRRLISQAAQLLKPKGVLMIEVGGCRKAVDRDFGHLQPHWFHTLDGSDCVCLFQAERLRGIRGARKPRATRS